MRHQSYAYLPRCRASPPCDRYQIILIGEKHMCVNNLPMVVTWKQNSRDSNLRHFESQVQCSNHYATRPEAPTKIPWQKSNHSKIQCTVPAPRPIFPELVWLMHHPLDTVCNVLHSKHRKSLTSLNITCCCMFMSGCEPCSLCITGENQGLRIGLVVTVAYQWSSFKDVFSMFWMPIVAVMLMH